MSPAPACRPGGVLVQSLFSLISTGTEMMKVAEAKMSMVGKARARPDQVRKVLDTVAQQGAVDTYKKVMNRLDSYTPLGYSLCGVVTEVGRGAEEFQVGQLVAAAGNEYALHAEYNWIPVNLCAAVPRGVSPEHAAFSTVGAIAMHGVRRAEVQLGDTACVIGLGLVGQLVVRLLIASGVRVIGLDVIEERCRLAEQAGAVLCAAPTGEGMAAVQRSLDEISGGRGADHVFLAAGGSSNAPVETAARLARDRARVVDIGKTQPGPAVERLLRQGTRRPVLPVLRTRAVRRTVRARGHRLPGRLRPLDRAPQPGMLPRPHRAQGDRGRDARVRRLPAGEREHCLRRPGLRLAQGRRRPARVPGAARGQPSQAAASMVRAIPAAAPRGRSGGRLAIGFIGAGNYASRDAAAAPVGLPNANLAHVATTRSLSAVNAQRRFGFTTASTNADAVLEDKTLDAIFIVTRHHTHANLVCRALGTGKAVFVEKPLALTREEVDRIVEVIASTGNDRLMVGFNRRFAPLLTQMKSQFGPACSSAVMRYLVSAGPLAADSWYRNDALEGSRFTGEGGHFIDTLSWWAGSLPEEVYAVGPGEG